MREEDLLEILHQEMPLHHRIFFRGSIPSKKLGNACRIHKIEQQELVLLLYDDTVLGSAKLGFIFTPTSFAFKGTLENPAKVEYRHLRVGDVQTDGKSVVIKGRRVAFTSDRELLSRGLAVALNRVIDMYHSSGVSPYRAVSPQLRLGPWRCHRCTAVNPIEALFCQSCRTSRK